MKTDLQKEFENVVSTHKPELDKQLKIASDAMTEVMKISEAHGIPFTFQGDIYIPDTFNVKFRDELTILEDDLGYIDPHEYFQSILNTELPENQYAVGWITSSYYC